MIAINDRDIKGEDYRSLVELAMNKCNKFAFVKRRDMMADEKLAMKNHDKLVKDIQGSFIKRSRTLVTSVMQMNRPTSLNLQKNVDFLLKKNICSCIIKVTIKE